MSAERLSRLLFIVPYATHRDGVLVQELAEKLHVPPAQILADLELLCMVGQPPLTPDHLIDVYVEDDVVYVDLDQSLSRPLRLTQDEARALVLAAKLVGPLGGLRSELDAAVDRILEHLNPVDRAFAQELAERVITGDEPPGPMPGIQLRRAIDEHRIVQLEYYSASSDRQKRYRLKPLALLNHTGSDYLVALDADAADQEKLFRVDRMGRLQLTRVTFSPPTALDLERFRRESLYFGPEQAPVRVRFSAAVATQVRERFAPEKVQCRPDGGLDVQLQTASPTWIARWVLPFGEAAEVVAPAEQRRTLANFCAAAAAAYGA